MKVAQMRGLKPIVDTIQEEEKYGNDGGFIRSGSNAFIRITEGASASLSKALGVRIFFYLQILTWIWKMYNLLENIYRNQMKTLIIYYNRLIRSSRILETVLVD